MFTRRLIDRKSHTKNSVTILLLGLVCIAAAIVFFRVLSRQLYQERVYNINQVMEQAVQTMDTGTAAQWDILNYCANRLQNEGFASKDVLPATLAHIEAELELPSTMLLAFDHWGNCYDSNCCNGRWLGENPLSSESSDHQAIVIGVPKLGVAKMLFLLRLPEGLRSQDSKTLLTHIAMVREMRFFIETFSTSSFRDKSSAYIIEPTGARIYQQGNEDAPIGAYNVLQALENACFLHGTTLDGMKADISNGRSDSVKLYYEGQPYFLAYSPMSINDWYALLFIPANAVGTNTTYIARLMLLFISIIAAIIILAVSLIIRFGARQLIAQKELAQEEMRKVADAANLANQAKSAFLSHISHDVRTPMNAIVGMTEIAKKNLKNPERVAECLKKITIASTHLLDLINNVLNMSRIERGCLELRIEPFHLQNLLEDCSVLIESQLETRTVCFEKQYEGLIHPYLLGDRLHLRQILINLLSNALKFTPDGGTITLRVKELASEGSEITLCFEVRDTGIGMSDAFQAHIFEAYMQERQGITQYQGTGLGMAIVKQLVTLMGGEISIESKLGKGSCFTVTLTFTEDTAPIEETDNAVQCDLNGLTVLLAEDNRLNREITTTFLEEQGVRIVCASDGREALERFRQSDIHALDAILMDVMMPEMDGLEAARAIRALARPDAGTIPIIALTAAAYEEDAQRIIAAGMNVHLTKPIQFDHLFSELDRQTRKQP